MRRFMFVLLTVAAVQLGVPGGAHAEERHGLRGDYYTPVRAGRLRLRRAQGDRRRPEPRLRQPGAAAAGPPPAGPTTSASAGPAGSCRGAPGATPSRSSATTASGCGSTASSSSTTGSTTGTTNRSASRSTLTAGQAYDIKVEYFEHFGGSNLHLRWQSARPGRRRPCPPSALPAARRASTTTGRVGDAVRRTAGPSRSTSPSRSPRPRPALTDHLARRRSAAPSGRSAPAAGPGRPLESLLARRSTGDPCVGLTGRSGARPAPCACATTARAALTDADGSALSSRSRTVSGQPLRHTSSARAWAEDVGPDNAHCPSTRARS